MIQNPPVGCQNVIPYLTYEDAPAAIDFLCRAFGFEEALRMPMDDGRLVHAELRYGDSTLMLASAYPELGLESPAKLSALHSQVCCYVDDVDAHFERARDAGAVITAEPEDQFYGDRSYHATDPEGHQWVFQTHIRDVDIKDVDLSAVEPSSEI